MKTFKRMLLAVILIAFLALPSKTQEMVDFGDAPETAVAYPSTGVVGAFPTCITVGQSWVQHMNFGAWLGPTFDFEPDGNGGLCPNFAPYDNDECFQDGDAGLMIPEPYTIISNSVVPCPGFAGTTLGTVCTTVNWGVDIDIDVTNLMPSATVGLMNVVIDFNQNGVWGDIVMCGGTQVPEHVLQNFPVPNGFAGPLSALGPTGFMLGPNGGYAWARFTISEQGVPQNWDGSGFFEDGESEDYLLHITGTAQSDLGDAPEDVLAYPSTGQIGLFPTCISVTAAGWVEHLQNGTFLGPLADVEIDGNAGLCPSFAPYDDDECFAGGDAGLTMPEPYTIAGGVVVTCPNSTGTSLGVPCDTARWGFDVDIDVNNGSVFQMDAYMNVLIDWNKNGQWGDTVMCDEDTVYEHALQNFIVPFGYVGPLSGLFPPDFLIGPDPGYFWSRFTISEMPVAVSWDGSGFFEDGESEDYLIQVDTAGTVEDTEYGDAPDGVLAYPASGIFGNFPTCMNVAASGYVSHFNFGAILGPSVDFESEGNAGLCPSFNPYDNDECFSDGDAGLLFPDPYTIQGGVVVTCPASVGTGLGNTCTTAAWGTHVDITVANNMPNQTIGYMNVLFDWNQDGDWGDVVSCPGASAPEHVLQNFAIPNGYSGPLSGLVPPNFIIGPNAGYVWARFTISETTVPLNWDGQGMFEDGESEDYLVRVDQPSPDAEYGDAPEGAVAYPSIALTGNFPTCTGVGPANHFVSHGIEEMIYFGPMKDFEPDGNAGACSPYALPYDNDECFNDGDAGMIVPSPYTIQMVGGNPQVVACVPPGTMMDTTCSMVYWGNELDITVTNLDTIDAVVNVLMDFNRNGRWDLDTTMQCAGTTIHEHVLVNFTVPSGYSGPLSALNPPPFMTGPNAGYIWSRFSISERNVVADWDGVDSFEKGESEDYLVWIDMIPGTGENTLPMTDFNIFPNPAGNTCNISYGLPRDAAVRMEVFDVSGRRVTTLIDEKQHSGPHSIQWNISNTRGKHAETGIFIIRVSLDNMPVKHAKILLN